MDYDVIIIGASLSGLAAGIRLAYFGKRVCILERHYAYGGLNSYYRLDGRDFDVGLHAVTNYAPRGAKGLPLTKLLRQLRLEWDELELCPQHFSEIRFPGRTLRFKNGGEWLADEIAREFPNEAEAFHRFVRDISVFDNTSVSQEPRRTRTELAGYFKDQTLIDMLLCPVMFYGSAEERDMDFAQFVTLFKSIYLEGFARPRGGVRSILTLLVKKFRALGGTLRMQSGVRSLETRGDRVVAMTLDSGESVSAETIFSSAGLPETIKLSLAPASIEHAPVGRLSFVETILILDKTPAEFGWNTTITFFNDVDRFTYARPEEAIDLTSGILCCPENYEGLEHAREGRVRLTWLANYERWSELDENSYQDLKRAYLDRAISTAARYVPNLAGRIVASDMFTPRTIERFTGRLQGAVYGSPRKIRDGRTPWRNLFLCGTDQGFLGIIGAMLSGITMVNMHVLAAE